MLFVKIMGCICSKGASSSERQTSSRYDKASEVSKAASVHLINPSYHKRDNFLVEIGGGAGAGPGVDASSASVHRLTRTASRASVNRRAKVEDKNSREIVVERPVSTSHFQRPASASAGRRVSRIVSAVSRGGGDEPGEAAGWPEWLTSVAGEAIKGLVPRRADSFEKLDKIGQGTYSSVYKARDLETGKIVALKKVRFVNMDPESVRFMAREIHILRRLDHPNVIKLEGLVTSRMSRNLYLVFDYMEHDLAGIAATPGVKFTQPQIKCYMQQLLRGLEHCHSRGVLHRDIKGSNILIDNNGILKIADFGLATFYDKNQPMTSRVVTLWYRAPELLLGSTEYGPAIDIWSTGCILAELFAGKPIMPGRTEVEQMHKIFKLCGSPSEGFWQRSKLPHATSFKPQQPYKRCVTELFKDFPPTALTLVDRLLTIDPERRGSAVSVLRSTFFSSEPLPCDPSSLPKFPPSKEFDVKLRNEEARRRKADNVRGRGPESVRRSSRDTKEVPTPEFTKDQSDILLHKQSNTKISSHKYSPQEEGGSGFRMEPLRGARPNGYAHSSSMVHPITAGPSQHKATSEYTRNKPELRTQRSHIPHPRAESSIAVSIKRDDIAPAKDSTMGYVPKKNRIHYSGPLVPANGNIEDMLKEHERQIQQAVRKARLDKARSRTHRTHI